MTAIERTTGARKTQRSEPAASNYRFLLMAPFRLPSETQYSYHDSIVRPVDDPKEKRLKNYPMIAPFLEGVDWDMHSGSQPGYGDWPVETREEFAYAATARLKDVREACETGQYNALVLLGGGEPGYIEAREICRSFGIVCTANGHAQMHLAILLGARFSVIDIEGVHNVYYRDLIYRYRFQDWCASIRNIGLRLPRPGLSEGRSMSEEREKALRGEPTPTVTRAIDQAEAAIVEDGAEVITFGCSATFWLQPFVRRGLEERGWDVPVLEGYSASIELAKMLVNLGVNASGLTFMSDRPKRLPPRIVV